MKIIITLGIIILSISMAESQDIGYAKRIIEKLSSAEFKGRGYTENGDKISAVYISNEYHNLNLLPLNGKSYFQKFSLSVNTLPGRVSVKIDGTELHTATDYLVESSCPSVNGRFQIIKTSRSQIDTEEKFASLVDNAADSFILIDCRDKKNEETDLSKKIDEYIKLLKHSPQIAIKGVIIYTNDKLTWESSTSQNIRPVVIINKELDLNTVNSIEITVDAKFKKNYKTQNVAGFIKGTSGSDSTLVVLAHYDHLGKLGKDIYFPGANDNASGVAMILNLAKHYSVNRPKYTMVFIALSGEEAGILGAKAFTDNPLIDLKKIKFLVNFDLAGTGDEGIKIVNGSVYKDKFDLITRINQQHELLPKVDIRGAACNSDHCLFYQKGVPCFYIYTQGGIQAYHDIFDKYETLPLTEFTDYCKLMIMFFDSITHPI
ncbi:MAG: M28 family peptidase [Bacteroidales bacterium]|nr:M28 family peptidase [Bacteroidales bacterium]